MAQIQAGFGHADTFGVPYDIYAGASGVVSGSTITMQTAKLLLIPAGTVATLTVVLPLNPVDGADAEIYSSQTITTLTVQANTGDSIVGAAANTLTILAAGAGSAIACARYKYTLGGYQAGNAAPINARTWVRVQ